MTCLKTLFACVCAALFMATAVLGQSSRPGWGSTPYSNSLGSGVTFRVWAPNATSVHVPGSFNSWSTSATPLGKELSNSVWTGVWSADVSSASTGQQYKYYINSTYTNGSPWRHDPRTHYVVQAGSAPGDNDIIYDPTAYNWTGDVAVRPPLEDLVVYELHIGDFYDPRSPNYPSSLPGRFIDATNKLAYLQSLGVSAVEVMPIMEFPGLNDWGYDPSDPFAADNYAYGGPDGFKTFVLVCHEHGLAVLLDVVHNHYGPTDLDLWDFDRWASGTGGGIYFYQSNDLCCTSYGSRPDYSTQQVRNYIQDNFTMWIDECHVDGFRWDTPGLMMNAYGYCCNPIADAVSLIAEINEMIHTNSGILSIAEDVTDYGFDSTWDGNFYQWLTPQLADTLDSERDMADIAYPIVTNTLFGGQARFNRVVYLESHDVVGGLNGTNAVRLVTAIDPSAPGSYRARKLSTLGAVLTFTAPGVPMIFEGQEMLENQQFDSSRPVDWTKTNTYSYIVRLYHDLISVRRDAQGYTPGLEGGQCQIYQEDNANKLLAYRRWASANSSQDVFVIANCSSNIQSNYSLVFPEAGVWYVHFNSDSTNYGPDYANTGPATVTAQGSPVTGSVTIGPYSALILSQTPPVPPQLTIGQTNGVLTLSWLNTYGWWVLDSSPVLTGNSTPWAQVPSTQFQTNAAAVFINPVASAGSVFYRLRNTKP